MAVCFVVSEFDTQDLRNAYGRLHKALNAAGFPLELTPTVVILRINNPFVKTLRKIFGRTKSLEGMRLGGHTMGNRFLDDAYVY